MARSKFDETDMRILAELDLDARATDTNIAKSVDISVPTVKTRMENMEQIGVIKGYTAIIDYHKLSYACHRLYLKLQNAGNDTRQSMIDFLKSSPYTRWVGAMEGRFDLGCSFWCQNHKDIFDIWNDFRSEYGGYIKEKSLVPHRGALISGLPFTKEILGRSNNCVIGMDFSGAKADIDEKDASILRILSSQGRATFSAISKSTGLAPAAVKYRVDQLIGKKIISGFRPILDMEMLGYTVHKVDFSLNSTKDLENMEAKVLGKANVSYLVRTAGYADIETRIHARTSKELYSVIHEIMDDLSEDFRDYNLFEFTNEVKTVYMPDFRGCN